MSRKIPDIEAKYFAFWINDRFGEDEDISHLLPLKTDGSDLYEKIGDGIIFWYVNFMNTHYFPLVS